MINLYSHKLGLATLVLSALFSLLSCSKKLDQKSIDDLYSNPLPTLPLEKKLSVYHLGHSLVGRDMPAMLSQLAGSHSYHSQLGWGATLQSHWDPKIPVNGFDEENKHKQYLDPFEAIASEKLDVFVLTEMVEIKDAIKYFDSYKYLALFAEQIQKQSPGTHIYLYETWHNVTDPAGWIQRLDNDFNQYWKNEVLFKALAQLDGQVPIYIIPVGQVLSAFFKEIETRGGIGNVSKPEDIFIRKDDGTLDPIHINDLGNYFVALVHYAVLYRRSPEGLPHKLLKADGSHAQSPSKETAELMQKITWDVVSKIPLTGVNPDAF